MDRETAPAVINMNIIPVPIAGRLAIRMSDMSDAAPLESRDRRIAYLTDGAISPDGDGAYAGLIRESEARYSAE